MATNQPTIGDVVAQMHADAHRLAEHVGTPDLANLRDRLDVLGDGLASVGDDREPASSPLAGQPGAGRRETVGDLVSALHGDLAVLAVRLHELAPTDESWGPIAKELITDSIQLRDLATGLQGVKSGYDLVAHVSPPKVNTKLLAGTTPGARPTSLDQAGRGLQSLLAQRNRQK